MKLTEIGKNQEGYKLTIQLDNNESIDSVYSHIFPNRKQSEAQIIGNINRYNTNRKKELNS